MKTIYVPVDSKVYKVNQDTRIPSTMCIKQPGYSSSLTKDPDNSTIIQSIDINTVLSQTHAAKTNGELYLDLLELLREKKITEIPIITNSYKVYVDYTLFVDNKETERSVVIKEVKPMDQVLPLGCSYNSELLYRRVTDVKANVCFKVRNTLPYGVMNQRKQNYMIQINDISIFQDFATYTDNHLSTFETPYPVGSKNVNSALDSCVLMYSTDADGVIIQPVSLNFAPRTVNININVILGHMVVAYDSKEVDDIVKYNIHHKYHPDDPYPPCPPIPPCPPPYPPGPWPPGPFPPGPFPPPMPDPHPTADGDDNPDAEGHSDWYERASETNPGALLVVEDMYEPQYFDPSVMIHKRKVIRDIPDIRVGEYVLYREGFEATLN